MKNLRQYFGFFSFIYYLHICKEQYKLFAPKIPRTSFPKMKTAKNLLKQASVRMSGPVGLTQ